MTDAPPPDDSVFAIYVHWPFCLSKCPYCDFNSHVAEQIDETRWRRALLAELHHYVALTPNRRVTSIFFGGGTPSLMDPETTGRVIAEVARLWQLAEDAEITLEANPSTVEAGRFREFAAAGVNRLSIGVQSLDDEALAFLGRGHSADEARRAVAVARGTFNRFSFDLIYARPGQSEADWRRELADALSLAGEHLSLYQLAIEPGTPFHRDGVPAATEEPGAALFDVTQDMTAAAGLPAYEISNHAKSGASCRHNMSIWRGADYVGVGPGAHGRLRIDGTTHATYQVHTPERWLERVESNGHGTAKKSPLATDERADELIMLGLRLSEGIDRGRFRGCTAVDFDEAVDGASLKRLIAEGFLIDDGSRVKASDEGRRCLDTLLGMLLA